MPQSRFNGWKLYKLSIEEEGGFVVSARNLKSVIEPGLRVVIAHLKMVVTAG